MDIHMFKLDKNQHEEVYKNATSDLIDQIYAMSEAVLMGFFDETGEYRLRVSEETIHSLLVHMRDSIVQLKALYETFLDNL